MNNSVKPLVLCVDDDEVTLRLLERLIRNRGCDVLTRLLSDRILTYCT